MFIRFFIGLVILFVIALIWRLIRSFSLGKLTGEQIEEIWLRSPLILDVRSKKEFLAGHLQGAMNIPIKELSIRNVELDPRKPILVCSAGGTRSALAAKLLLSLGFPEVYSAGRWTNLNDLA